MQQKFDIFGRVERNPLILCNIDGEELDIMNVVKDVQGSMRYNAVSELSFSVPKQVNNKIVPYYDSVQSKKNIKIYGLGIFVIEGLTKSGDGLKEIKNVSAKSLEYEMSYKTIDYLEGTYPLYNAGNPQGTLLYEVLQYIPNWTIGIVDVEFVTKYRTFSTEGQNVYDFLLNDVSQAYECVFEFDTFNRIINVKTPQKAIKKTDIFMSYRNLIKTIDVEENSNEMFTALRIYGDGDLDIATVNPLGSNVIYNFDYYKNVTWMSQDLINAIDTWETKIGNNIVAYGNALIDLKNKNSQRIGLVGDLTQLQSDLQALQVTKDVRQQQGLDYSDVEVEIGKKNTQINNKKTEINNKQAEIDVVSNDIKTITDECSFKNNFTTEQLKKLDTFIIENTYQNEWFITTESMTNEQVRDVALELYEDGQTALNKISKPTYRFSVDSVNFLSLKEFKDFAEQLELASEVAIDMDDGNFVYPYLVGYDFDYENENSFNLVFSDKLRYDSNDYAFGELFSDVSKLGSSAISKASSANQNANSAYDKANSAYNSSVLANIGAFQNKFDLMDMGKKTQALQQMADEITGRVIEINDEVSIIEHTIAEKQVEWDKINGITDEMGKVLAGEIAGNLNSSVNNIVNADGTVKFLGNGVLAHNLPSEALSTRATLLNAEGLLVANGKKPDGSWSWTTAISGDGINASSIKTGILDAVNIGAVKIIGSEIQFGTMTGTKLYSAEIKSGKIETLDMTAGKLKGGLIEGVRIETAELYTSKLFGAEITGVNITGTSSITGAVLNGSTIYAGDKASGNYILIAPGDPFKLIKNNKTLVEIYESDEGGYLFLNDGQGRESLRLQALANGNSQMQLGSRLNSTLEIFGNLHVHGSVYASDGTNRSVNMFSMNRTLDALIKDSLEG